MTARSFRDLAVGETLRGSARTLSEADLTFACMASGDWAAIHADAEYARTTPLGGPVLHGGYVLMIALGMSAQLLHFREPVLALLGLDDWRFRSPCRPGDTIRLDVAIEGLEETSEGRRGIVRSRLNVTQQDGRTVQEGKHALMLSLEA